ARNRALAPASLADCAGSLPAQRLLRGHGLSVRKRPPVHGGRHPLRGRGVCRMSTVAYVANEFPSAIETYVKDEISELRRRGVRVIPCSGKRVSCHGLSRNDRAFWDETLYFQPLSDQELVQAIRRLTADKTATWPLLKAILLKNGASPAKRLRAL